MRQFTPILRPVIWSLVHVTNHVLLLPLPAIGRQCLPTAEETWHVDTPCISLACGILDSTSILRFSLIYAYPRFCCFPALRRFHHCFPALRHCHRRFPTLCCTHRRFPVPSPQPLLHSYSFWRFGPLPRALCDLPLYPCAYRTTFLTVSASHPRSWTLSLVYTHVSTLEYLRQEKTRLPQTEFSSVSPSQFRFQRAPCSSPAFLTPLHASAALATPSRRVSNLSGHL